MKTMRTHAGTRVTASVAGVVVAGATLVAGATGATAADTNAQLSSGTCETTADEIVTNTHRHGWDFAATGAAGHDSFGESGLDIWTDSATGNKVAAYRAVDFPLSGVGAGEHRLHRTTRPSRSPTAPAHSSRSTSTRTASPTATSSARRSTVATGGRRPRGEQARRARDLRADRRRRRKRLQRHRRRVGRGARRRRRPGRRLLARLGCGRLRHDQRPHARLRHVHLRARGRPTNEVGDVVDGPVATNIDLKGWDFASESGTAGHYDFLTTGGVKIWTDAFPEGESGEQSAIAAVA